MAHRRRDRERRSARQEPFRDPRPRILVVCEGEVTEQEYLNSFRGWCRNPRVRVYVDGPAGVPLTLVQRAIELKEAAEREAEREGDENLLYEEVWCMFDFDEHPNVPQARQLAKQHQLRIAMSNPCFELWLLLHLRDNPGPQHRRAVQKMLRRLMPGVEPKHIDFEQLIPGYEQAVGLAGRLEREAAEANDHGRNPSTEVFHLTNSIDQDGVARRAAAKRAKNDQSRRKAEAAADAAMKQASREQLEIKKAETHE